MARKGRTKVIYKGTFVSKQPLIGMRIPSDINPPFKVVEVKAKSDGQKYALKILKDSAKSR
jgi:hypothetical protein